MMKLEDGIKKRKQRTFWEELSHTTEELLHSRSSRPVRLLL